MKRKTEDKRKPARSSRKGEVLREVAQLKDELRKIKKRSKGVLVDVNSMLRDAMGELKLEERIIERLRGTHALVKKGLREIKFTAVKHVPGDGKIRKKIEKTIYSPGIEKNSNYKKALAYVREHPVGSRMVVFACEDKRGKIFRKLCVRHHFEIYDPEDGRVYLTSEFAHRLKKKGLALLAKGRMRDGRVSALKFFRHVSF